jgi:hypothetical protein
MLWHLCVDEDSSNLMATTASCSPVLNTNPDRINPVINNVQTLLIRASKHVSYFKKNIMKSKQYIINHPSQLNSLSTFPFTNRPGLGKIVFNDSFQHSNKEQMEHDLNKNYYACGCSQGAKALLIGLLVFGVFGLYGFYYYDWSVTKCLISFFGGAILMSLLGKFIGLVQANRKLKKTIGEIQCVWKPDWPEAKTIGCS